MCIYAIARIAACGIGALLVKAFTVIIKL